MEKCDEDATIAFIFLTSAHLRSYLDNSTVLDSALSSTLYELGFNHSQSAEKYK